MAGTIFWDVDTQVDFMVPEGKLYVPGAVEIGENLARLTGHARQRRIPRVASVCDHVMEDAEISTTPDFQTTFPPHCLRGSPGQRKIAATAMEDPVLIPNRALDLAELRRRVERHAGEVLIEKNHFDVFSNPNTAVVLDALSPETIVVFGVAQDVCDAHAIAGFLRRGGCRVVFVADAAKPIDAKRGAELLAEWQQRGVVVATTADVLAGRVGGGSDFPAAGTIHRATELTENTETRPVLQSSLWPLRSLWLRSSGQNRDAASLRSACTQAFWNRCSVALASASRPWARRA